MDKHGNPTRARFVVFRGGEGLRDLLRADPENPLSDEELGAAFDLQWYLRHVDDIYARFGM